MRIPPNVAARISGTRTIANTFQRTGQLVSDHRDGRFAGAGGWGSNSAMESSAGFSGVSEVIAARPRYRSLVRA
jgi:hypothetical protein